MRYLVIILCLFVLSSCTTTKYVPVETTNTEVAYRADSTEINRLLKQIEEIKLTLTNRVSEKVETTNTIVLNEQGDTLSHDKETLIETLIENTATTEKTIAESEETNTHTTMQKNVEQTEIKEVPVEVEKELSAWQKFKINFAEIIIGVAVLVISLLALIILLIRRK